jgi:hypothetical protein
MARPYSKKFIDELLASQSDKLGVQLGRVCYQANLPATYVAKALGVSRVTVYSWFRGQGMREEKRGTIEALISILKQDLDAGVLPVPKPADAKVYIEQVVGVNI